MKKSKRTRFALILLFLAAFLAVSCGQRATGETGADNEEEAAPDASFPEEEAEEEEEPAEPKEMLSFVTAHGEHHTVEVRDDFAKHDYDFSGLRVEGETVIYDDARYTLHKGIDVSRHQGAIDWPAAAADGIEFAFVRLAYRGYGPEGNLREDERALENLRAAKAAGIRTGVYVFSQAVNEAEALEEADFALALLDGLPLELPVVFDPERIQNDEARTDGVTGKQFTKNTRVFCDRIREAGYEPMVYANMLWEAYLLDLKELKDIPVWYADYEPVPQTPYAFVCWQYSESGTVAGIEGGVDLDVWFEPAADNSEER